jgi:hypothetical protein
MFIAAFSFIVSWTLFMCFHLRRRYFPFSR